ncbi:MULTISPECIES: biotin synthase BioB [Acidithiobacillus]|jgi:biotin synthase|uniref:Biotin synthase n=3 Tax=Acidithiobacillus caldus TaxID=33059 RepID=F9ZQR8_ACICS|nr:MULTISPECIES: biotin synthase BioB [Acidithiobacillus]AEK59257.1 Biotin synthase [Acidithiobacillus caldus SM-1]AIA56300.1 Biotin synthase [Acidithiobacillus caldus ATCC 51756]AUW33639.1 biotin synthase BioB [Acidithiobacillus caldus]MBU2728888.1 biotin synthase BioB [Acidithiobacillus caldus]MBU2735331.1 biotin synthase BioB [Acidithiobacillus caldus ATCC 51756]
MTTATAPNLDQILEYFELPFNDLIFQAQQVHRQHFDANALQHSTLLSIKTGNCPEDCGYCAQSVHHQSDTLAITDLLSVEAVREAAAQAKAGGAQRFCMGAAWRSPHHRDLERVALMVRAVKELGLETCVTLGMLNAQQAQRLAEAGLDYYNHNLDTSPEFYGEVIHTRSYQERLDTLEAVRNAGIKVCSGGILGLGESRRDRARLLQELAKLPTAPESIPINALVPIPGTPLEHAPAVDEIEFVRTIAVARLLFPASYLRLAAGRERMSDSLQALCFLAGANSIFLGERLLTTHNAEPSRDQQLFTRLGLHPAS